MLEEENFFPLIQSLKLLNQYHIQQSNINLYLEAELNIIICLKNLSVKN